jgi:hypothetical protein
MTKRRGGNMDKNEQIVQVIRDKDYWFAKIYRNV